MILKGNIVDIINRIIFKGEVHIRHNKIECIVKNDTITETHFILPGLVDAHIHIESSMLIPSEFARLASVHGTVATVSDPHEIANVLGVKGIDFMIENGKEVDFKFYFGAPSCVPATPFETSGATIDSKAIEELMSRKDIKYLSEMMNFPGVLNDDKEVLAKLAAAKKYQKPIDGHAPGLKGDEAEKYVKSGISTDHECFTISEALDKIKSGMFIQIREGSAAKNYHTLAPLINSHPKHIMLCSDDKHPNDLEKGHMDEIIRRALKDGYDLMNILTACILNPVKHYKLEVGLLQEGDPADCIIVDNMEAFNVLKTYSDGVLIAENNTSKIKKVSSVVVNKFFKNELTLADLRVSSDGGKIKVIQAIDGELITPQITIPIFNKKGFIESDISKDILKILVLNRYGEAKPAIGFIRGFGFKKGAIASSVAHDSHNIIAVGVNDKEILKAMELVIRKEGGISWVDGEKSEILGLPIAGIMSNDDAWLVAKKYENLDILAKSLGGKLQAPYMTLSFMALLVIPELKLSDKGLFDGTNFVFTDLIDK